MNDRKHLSAREFERLLEAVKGSHGRQGLSSILHQPAIHGLDAALQIPKGGAAVPGLPALVACRGHLGGHAAPELIEPFALCLCC